MAFNVRASWLLAALALVVAAGPLRADVTLTEGTNIAVDIAADGRITMDLLGGLWVLPATGGRADPVANGLLPAERPRWSPDASALIYQAQAASRHELWLYSFEKQAAHPVSVGEYFDQHPGWHPDGLRIVYSSDRRDSGFDLWELDLPTGLTWRMTNLAGDETEPAWSADGRDLVYIRYVDATWMLMLRPLGEQDQVLVTSTTRLSAPSWRPDGSLVAFLRHGDTGISIDIAILSDPPLVRTLIADGDIFDAPVAWRDRHHLLYTANGAIRQRQFDSWTSFDLPFEATVEQPAVSQNAPAGQRDLPVIDAPVGQLVIRARRFFDGVSDGYQNGLDIVVEGGRIAELEPPRDRSGAIVVDMGDLTVLPGFVDSYAALPQLVEDALGSVLLSYGVTTMLVAHPDVVALDRRWSGKDSPGPRLLPVAEIGNAAAGDDLPWLVTIGGKQAAGVELRASVGQWQSRGVPVNAKNWRVGLGSGATMLLGAESLPVSPRGVRYADIELANGAGRTTIVSGLADARTSGLGSLLESRQAALAGKALPVSRRFAEPRQFSAGISIIAGSRQNRLPPGIALQAELRALVDAGLSPSQALRSAGSNAAAALGLGAELGRIGIGSAADLVIVDGDPLGNIADAARIVGIVRNGRFFSAIGLIERAGLQAAVE